jgi:hypothetical protein
MKYLFLVGLGSMSLALVIGALHMIVTVWKVEPLTSFVLSCCLIGFLCIVTAILKDIIDYGGF